MRRARSSTTTIRNLSRDVTDLSCFAFASQASRQGVFSPASRQACSDASRRSSHIGVWSSWGAHPCLQARKVLQIMSYAGGTGNAAVNTRTAPHNAMRGRGPPNPTGHRSMVESPLPYRQEDPREPESEMGLPPDPPPTSRARVHLLAREPCALRIRLRYVVRASSTRGLFLRTRSHGALASRCLVCASTARRFSCMRAATPPDLWRWLPSFGGSALRRRWRS